MKRLLRGPHGLCSAGCSCLLRSPPGGGSVGARDRQAHLLRLPHTDRHAESQARRPSLSIAWTLSPAICASAVAVLTGCPYSTPALRTAKGCVATPRTRRLRDGSPARSKKKDSLLMKELLAILQLAGKP